MGNLESSFLAPDAPTRERLRAHDRESELYAAMWRALPEPAFVFSLEGDDLGLLVDASEAAAELLGRDLNGLRGRNLADVMEAASLEVAELRNTLERDGDAEVEGELLRPDGGRRAVLLRVRPFHAAGRRLAIALCRPQVGESNEERAGSPGARFRLLADTMPQLVWTARPDGTVDYYNERVSQYEGFRQSAEREYEWAPVLHPDDVQLTEAAWRTAIETGTMYECEHRVRMLNGSFRWHLSRGLPLRDSGGAVVRWYGTATDIHDVKAAEAEVQAARDRLEVALEAAEMGTWESDFVAKTSHRSLRHDQIFGYDELQPVWSLEIARQHVHPDDLDAFEEGVRRGEDTGKLHHELRIRRPDGTIRWISSLGRYYYDDAGRPTRRAGVIMDITERKQIEAALVRLNQTLEEQVAERTAQLQSTRDHFEALFNASPVAAAIIRLRDTTLLEVNDELARFFGRARTECVGRTMAGLGVDLSREQIARYIDHVRQGKHLRDEEITLRIRGEDQRVVLASVEMIKVGEDRCALAMFIDITGRKEAEEAVRQLTSALTLAEQRERRRLSQVLHDDLQQILFGVEMRAAVLQQMIDEGEGNAETLKERIDGVRDLIAGALRTTRVLAVELNPPVLPGEGLAPSMKWLARHMEELHHLEVDVNVAPEVELACEDRRVLLIQLTRELLFNVVKHARVAKAHLVVSRPGERLRIVVQDHGVGFDSGLEAALSNARRRSLGLFSIEQRLALFGGTLTIDSEPGRGTRVQIDLPLDAHDLEA